MSFTGLATRVLGLATVIGVLVEVPVMLSVVSIAKRSRGWYDAPLADLVGRHRST